MLRRNQNRRRSMARAGLSVPALVDSLENRALLAAVVEAIQIDGQAPGVLSDAGAVPLMFLQDAGSTRLFRTDGTQAGTVEIADIAGLFDASDVVGTVNGKVVFRVESESVLWASDGTVDGTTFKPELVLPSTETYPGAKQVPLESIEFNGHLYFSAKGSEGEGFELWRTDGTFGGTELVHDINRGQITPTTDHTFYWDAVPGAVSYDVSLRVYASDHNAGNFGSVLIDDPFFTATAVSTTELQVTIDTSSVVGGPGFRVSQHHFRQTVTPNFGDDTQGAAESDSVRLFTSIDAVSSHPSDFEVFNGELYFAAEDPLVGRELFRTSGQGATLVTDLVPGRGSSNPVHLMEFDGSLFFGSNGNHDLYRTDGTTDGTVRVLEGEGVSHVWGFEPFNQTSFYSPQQLAGTFPIAEVNGKLIVQQMGDGAGSIQRRLVALGNADDATPTVLGVTGSDAVFAPHAGGGGYFDGFTVVNNRLIFRKSSYSTGTDGSSQFGHLWATDGETSEQLFDRQIWHEHHSGKRILNSLGSVVGDEVYLAALTPDHFGAAAYSAVYRTDGSAANSVTLSSTDYLAAGGFTRGNQYVTVGDVAYYLKPQGTDISAPTLWDLYQVNAGSETDTLIDTDLRFEFGPKSPLVYPSSRNDGAPELFEFNDALFVKLATHDGPALFTISEGPTDDAILVNGGIGTQTDARPTLTWPDPGFAVDRYDLYINRVGNRSTAVYRRTNLTTNSHTLETTIGDGDYEVWVRAYYSDGTVSRWGAQPPQMTINAGSLSDGPPVVISPDTFVSLRRPEFVWTGTLDAERYEIWVSTAASNAPLIHETNLFDTSFTPTTDLSPGIYHVWVRAHFSDDSRTAWSFAKRFQIQSDPVTITGGVGGQSDTTPLLTWDDPGNVARYDLYIGQQGVAGPVYRRTDLTTNSHELETPLPPIQGGGSYLVWVRAYFNDGSFTPWQTAPELLEIVTVSLSISSPHGRQFEQRPVITWQQQDQFSVDLYGIRIFFEDSSTPLIEDNVVADSASHTELEMYVPTQDLAPGRYRVQIRAQLNGEQFSDWGLESDFEVMLLTGGVGGQLTGQPTITWTPMPNAVGYEVYVSEDGTPAIPVYHRTELTEPSHQIAVNLPNGVYDVWVRTEYDDGTHGYWGKRTGLFVGESAAFENTSPEITFVDNQLVWTSVPGVEAYEVHIDGQSPFVFRAFHDSRWLGANLNAGVVLSPGDYRMWVRAIDSSGVRGPFSESGRWYHFTIVSVESDIEEFDEGATQLASLFDIDLMAQPSNNTGTTGNGVAVADVTDGGHFTDSESDVGPEVATELLMSRSESFEWLDLTESNSAPPVKDT